MQHCEERGEEAKWPKVQSRPTVVVVSCTRLAAVQPLLVLCVNGQVFYIHARAPNSLMHERPVSLCFHIQNNLCVSAQLIYT